MNLTTCKECLTVFEYEDKLPRRGSICFRCHIKGPTIKERQEQQVKDAIAGGYDPQPVGSRWV
jgi:hypothetical protein